MKGKAGDHKPLDSKEDFEPTKKEPEQMEMDTGTPGAQPTPTPIQHGKMLAHFVRAHLEKEESGSRYLGFEFSFPLTKEHAKNGHLPGEINDNWKIMLKGNIKRLEVESVHEQTIAIGLVPDDKTSDLILVGAEIRRTILDVVEETGSGKTQKVVRLSFRAFVELDKKFWDFTFNHFGDSVWLSLKDTQASLLD